MAAASVSESPISGIVEDKNGPGIMSLDDKKAKVFDEMRAKVDALTDLSETEKKWLDDACLHRYLRARDFKLDKAFSMLNASIKWRRDYGVVDIMLGDLTKIEQESESGKLYMNGLDKLGRPLLYMKPKLQNSKQSDSQIQHLVYTLERCIAAMPAGVEKLVLVIDFSGFSMRNAPSISQQKETLSILQNHTPERLGVALCFNAPSLFFGLYKIIKPFVDPVTASKIQFLSSPLKAGSDEANLVEELVGISCLETEYGGGNLAKYNHSTYFQSRIVPSYTQ
mmetsp:Transcript_6307/g.11240  ORF Transcript_6307/g.11240 Transcript_6307/m.11240 type:complete len:281 (-) Transcript_6307:1832-2674(-)